MTTRVPQTDTTTRDRQDKSQSLQQNRPRGQQGLARSGGAIPSVLSDPMTLLMNPFAFMHRFSEEMDRLFGEVGQARNLLAPGAGQRMGATGATGMTRAFDWIPQTEAFERDGQLVIRVDLPGVNKDDVRVEVSEGVLTIEGERRYEGSEDEGGLYRTERSYGRFVRQIALPEGANPDEAKANFNNGVLEITIPIPKQQTRRLEIQESGGEQETGRQQATASQSQQQPKSGEQNREPAIAAAPPNR